MSLNTKAGANALKSLLDGLSGLSPSSVQIGVPVSAGARVSAFVVAGSQSLVNKTTGVTSRDARYNCTLVYRVDGAEATAETTLMDLLDAFIAALQDQSRFTDDSIQSGENLLLTFTNIGKDTFPAATQAMVDLAQAMGTDASGSAIQLGKALNDTTKGITALTRVGVSFSDEQIKLIKHLQETGDMAGAVNTVLTSADADLAEGLNKVTAPGVWVLRRLARWARRLARMCRV